MIASRKLLNIRGYDVRASTYFCVSRALTEAVDDEIYECVDDYLKHGKSIDELIDHQSALVEVLKYYLNDTCTPEVCLSYNVIGDSRNNPVEREGKEFVVEVIFTAKHSLVPTRIQYIIQY